MDLIQKWLDGERNYIIGRIIYQNIGKDDGLKSVLSGGNTAQNQALLEEALSSMITPAAAAMPVRPVAHAVEDDVIKAIRAERSPISQQMNKERHDLHQFGESNDAEAISVRKELAFSILDKEQDVEQLWDKEKYYREHGTLPFVAPVTVPIPDDKVKLAAFIRNVERNIRRNRQLMKEHPDKPIYAQKYEEYKSIFQKATGEEYKEVKNG